MIKTKDFEIATKEEAVWIRAKENCEARIKVSEESLIIERAFLNLCVQKIKFEGEKK